MAYRQVYLDTTDEYWTYDGEGEVCVVEFEGSTTANALAIATEQAIIDEGGTLLSLRIWQNGNRWKTEAVVHGSPVLQWVTIIGIILAALVTIVVLAWAYKFVTTGVRDFVWGPEPRWNPKTEEWEWPKSIFEDMWKLVLAAGAVFVGVYLLKEFKPIKKRI